MSVTTVSSSMITDATILNADIGAAAAIATTKLGAGAIVQVVNVQDGAVATGTTAVPDDDTIPQKTEGDEYMTLAITPTSASNKLFIQVVVNGDCNGEKVITAALFQDTTAGALSASQSARDGATNDQHQTMFNHYMAAGTTSATTFKVRAGAASNTFTFNGHTAGRLLGGVMSSSMTITEISA